MGTVHARDVQSVSDASAPAAAEAKTSPSRKRRKHRIAVALLLVVGTLLTPIAMLALFLKAEIGDTNRYVQNVAPLSSDPAIQSYVADDISQRLFAAVDVRAFVESTLPDRAQPLVGPLTGAFESFVRATTLRVVQSSQFQKLWESANRTTHKQIVNLLEGDNTGAFVVGKDGVISIDVSAIVTELQKRLQATGIDLFSKIPIVAIGRKIPIVQSKNLYSIRKAAKRLDQVAFVLPFIVFGCFGGAIFLSARRRRAFLLSAIGFSVGALILGVALVAGRRLYLDAATSSQLPYDAAAAIFDTLVRFLHTSVRTALTLSVVVIIAVFFAGPSRLTTWFRSTARTTASRLGAESDRAGWKLLGRRTPIADHKGLLRAIVAAVAFVILFRWQYPSPVVVFSFAAIVLALLALIEYLGRDAIDLTPPPGASGPNGPARVM